MRDPIARDAGPERPRTQSALTGALAAVTAAVLLVGLAACGGSSGGSKHKGEVVITCASCQASPNDPFLQYDYEAVQRFNKRFAGKYRVRIIQNQHASSADPNRLQYYQRLALANDLPDVFLVGRNELDALAKTGKLMDFKPALNRDGGWKGSFYDGAFQALTAKSGQVWAIPQERDAIGIYYNKDLLREAGVTEFPRTWQELNAACSKVKAHGKICLALDGDWVTLLMWANLIGTQPGGKDFLFSGLAKGDYASNPAVVKATETLKTLHGNGFVNRDSLSGEFSNAATPFVRGDAAMIANGPWMVATDIKGKNARKGLYEQIGYEPSPGWSADARGIIVVAGNGGWVSGSRDERKQEAVAAFTKFMTSQGEALAQTRATGAYPAVKMDLSPAQSKSLEPLAARLVKESAQIPNQYAHVFFSAPAGFEAAWKNNWPAYVQGKLSTSEFLDKQAKDTNSPTG